ncbi:MAG: hypothetical protein Q7T54_04835 [Candidatus Levybacteria bacterium]|nr:hypothetical protein [Candidatus Levybacteria bacterium]
MKKILGFASAFPALLMSAPQVFAQATNDNLNPCPKAGQFSVLCGFNDLGAVLGFVITIAFIIAVLIALFFLIWGGIKWITSGGDKGGVEAARNQIIAAVIGLIIVFLAFFILNLVLGLFGLSLFSLKLPNIADFK